MFQVTFESSPDFSASFEKNNEEMNARLDEMMISASGSYQFGTGLLYDPATRTVSVDTAAAVTAGDRRPVTSAAVQVEIGNIGALLQLI